MRILAILIVLTLISAVTAQTGSVTVPLCPPTEHDRFHITGPDLAEYQTWHPVYDIKHGCHFDHDHGSDPSLFSPGWGESFAVHPNWPLFNYTATAHSMPEAHAGFKVYVFEWKDYLFMVTQHQGSGNAMAAACNRYHTLDVSIKDSSGVLVAEIHTMADYGKATSNSAGLPALTPAACPNQAAEASGSNGTRQFPVVSLGNIGYEPWRADNTPNAFSACWMAFTIRKRSVWFQYILSQPMSGSLWQTIPNRAFSAKPMNMP